jgi:hypothetical protein
MTLVCRVASNAPAPTLCLKAQNRFDSFAELTNTILVNVRHPPYTKMIAEGARLW